MPRHTVTHRTPEGYHVVALPHDPGRPDQHAAALVRDEAHAAAVAELLDQLTAEGDGGATAAGKSKRRTGAKAR